ncbi:MAG: serine acetyltransferase [Oscillospiraceae bacterium]|jgi:serine O-acetyltransferase|nr:serine acetyltransferase [Oscillospiraceae bacterium]
MDQTLPIMTREIARRLEELDASLDPAAPDAGGLRLQAERFTDLMIDALFPRFAFDRTSRESRLLQAAGVLEDCLSHIPSSPPLESVFSSLLEHLPEVRRQLQTDLVAAYQGDPAAKSVDEVVLCYPAFKAISTYRLAHVLYVDGVPLLPRMMTEYAHRLTGIDIHPGARIGDSFFIDHGTGVVIGETTTIGCNVKLYQHVTLGAKSFEVGEDGTLVKGIKRHPDIGDRVVIYSGATILGGETQIGNDCIIGGSVWLTHSVPAGKMVLSRIAVTDTTLTKERKTEPVLDCSML